MASTNYHPNRLLFRPETAGQTWLWNSTDSEIHFMRNRATINKRYTEDNVHYTYNDMGYRTINFNSLDSDFVLCFGCSYTEGVGVTDSDTWPAMLENRLETQCINLGMGGSSMDIQLINATQWIKNRMPLPRAVVLQIPEVTRTANAWLRYNQYWQYLNNAEADPLNYPEEYSSIFLYGTTASHRPGSEQDDNICDNWKKYNRQFPAEIKQEQYDVQSEITPWFLSSMRATTFQVMWNSIGVPVFQMTYDDDGDTVYNPYNVFRITGEYNLDYGRDNCHQGPITHKQITKVIAPHIKELFDWDGVSRQRHDITRTPHDLTHKTLNEAQANLHKFDKRKTKPFIYE